ncbi:hypothetical protein HOG98_02005 [bacterium]|jgi:hypothetical protein|nr:hypothetical protein [bacterium]
MDKIFDTSSYNNIFGERVFKSDKVDNLKKVHCSKPFTLDEQVIIQKNIKKLKENAYPNTLFEKTIHLKQYSTSYTQIAFIEVDNSSSEILSIRPNWTQSKFSLHRINVYSCSKSGNVNFIELNDNGNLSKQGLSMLCESLDRFNNDQKR